MTAETDIAAIDDAGWNTASEVRTALTSVLSRADLAPDHGALSGLGDNDHPQYALLTGATFSGLVTLSGDVRVGNIYDSGGVKRFGFDATYTNFYNNSGAQRLWLAANDNYYNANNHHFRNSASTNLAKIDANGRFHIAGDLIYFGGISSNDYFQMSEASNYFRMVIDGDEAFRFTASSNQTYFDLMDSSHSHIRKTEGLSLYITNEVANQDIFLRTDNGGGPKNRIFIDGSANTIKFYNHDGTEVAVISSEILYSKDLGAGIWGGFKADTAGTNRLYFRINSTDYYLFTTGAIAPTTDNARDLGASTLRFDDVYATNGTIQTSDPRMKKNLRESDLGLDFIKRLEPAAWEFKDGRRPHYGLDAGQVQRVLAELGQDFAGLIDPSYGGKVELNEDGSIKYDKDGQPATDHDPAGPLGLRYTEFVGPIVKAIQELNEKIERRAA